MGGHRGITLAPGLRAPFAVGLSTLEFARLASAGYGDEAKVAGGFTRHGVSVAGGAGSMRQRWQASGFQAAVFRRTRGGGGVDHVLSLAGTQDADDARADLGFGGRLATATGLAAMFEAQRNSALEILRAARGALAGRDRLYLTGHSLGGGLAQLVAAATGVAAVTFHPVPVRALDGALADYARNEPEIVNFRFDNDPVNAVGVFSLAGGRSPYLGRAYAVPTPRRSLAAHKIPLTIKELSPAGQFAVLGAADPFNDGAVRNALRFGG